MFYYLLLGHLLGDFTFQTGKIAENKLKYWRWNLLHSSIITICMLILLFPFNSYILGFILLNGILHFMIDSFKSKLSIKSSLGSFLYFILDQVVHIMILYWLSTIIVKISPPLLIDVQIIKFLIILVFISSFSAILIQFILKAIFPAYQKKFFNGNEKGVGQLTRIVSFFIFYLSFSFSIYFLIGLLAIIIGLIIYYNRKWRTWMSLNYFIAKLFMDVLISMIGFIFLLIQE
ncbi:DUF3307 domain-containing protein [Tepidibacillus decaturensis]|uniref:DUF3307 domain-containing protein n=2 Tax=Tepidibacillus TaxID=1494427 RepID=A0A135L4B2_9BACI|nr:DUF3307 domain-containing protein [Tepidibacillus decaturensis]KXG43854.1 hypothetical protein U473_07415 [Tepidibacillus decaturensis]